MAGAREISTVASTEQHAQARETTLLRRSPVGKAKAPRASREPDAATAPPAAAAAKGKGSSPSPPRRPYRATAVVAMAASVLALAVALLLGASSRVDHGAAAAPVSEEGLQVTYGSTVKLMHEKTKVRLHSHDVAYGSGSGQQSVTGFPEIDDSNSYWIVRPTLDSSAKQGDAVETGSIIRLQHMRTRRWLHSHLHASPLSGNLEVSCFGGDGQSDTGDYWRLEIEGKDKVWKRDQKVRLRHVDTGGYLHSHNKKYNRLGGGQQEVCGVRDKRAENIWSTAEGVYLPVDESK